MKLDKAIEIQTNFINGRYPGSAEQFKEAVTLGIEALKSHKIMRQIYASSYAPLLPGEEKPI